MKKIISYIMIIAMLMVFVFSMTACNNDEQQSGKISDLVENKTIERIDYFLGSNKMIEESKTCEIAERTMMYFYTMDEKGKLYSRTEEDFDFTTIRDAYLNLEYQMAPKNIVIATSQDRIILFFTDGTYLMSSVWEKFWYVDSDGKMLRYIEGSMLFDSVQTDVLELAMISGLTGVPYNSFEDYWATIESNQFWGEAEN